MTRRLVALWAPVVGFMVAVVAFGDEASLAVPEMFWDKALHVLAYLSFGLACMRAFHGGFRRPVPLPTLGAVLLTVGFGAFDEWRQAGVWTRDASVADWAADGIGAALSWLALRCWPWRK